MTDTPEMRFDDKVVVVTGAGNGLGREYALQLAARGAKVVVNDLGGSTDGIGNDQAAAARVVEQIRSNGGEAVASFDSVATEEGGAAIIRAAIDNWGRVDAVIANAGILRDKSFAKLTAPELDILLDVHLRGTFFTVHPAFTWMRENGGGNIVVTASPSALFGAFGQSNYCAAKLGVVGMMQVMAIEGAKAGIKVNALAPTAATRLTATAGMSDEPREPLPPEQDPMSTARVSPLVLALAHESCPASGEIFNAGCGWISRAVIAVNEGVMLDSFTPEAVSAQWETLRDPSNLSVPQNATDYWHMIQAHTGAQG